MSGTFGASLVKIGKKTKRISLQRFLLSKCVYEPDRIVLQDLVCLYENQLWLERKSLKDPNFFRKFSDNVFTISFLLKEADLKSFNNLIIRRFSKRIRARLQDFLVPERHYLQWKKRFSGRFSLQPNILNRMVPSELTNKVNPTRSIGIGYRDKGSRRNLAKDGSPDWREVASVSEDNNDWRKELKDAKDFKDIERIFFKIFPDEDWGAYFAEKTSSVSAESSETTQRSKAKAEDLSSK